MGTIIPQGYARNDQDTVAIVKYSLRQVIEAWKRYCSPRQPIANPRPPEDSIIDTLKLQWGMIGSTLGQAITKIDRLQIGGGC